MDVYIVSYSQESSGPEFSVIVANNWDEAKKFADDVVEEIGGYYTRISDIRKIDLSKDGVVRTGNYCC